MPNAQLELTHLEGALHYLQETFSANNQIDKLILEEATVTTGVDICVQA